MTARLFILSLTAAALFGAYVATEIARTRLTVIHARACDVAALTRWQAESPDPALAYDAAAVAGELVDMTR